MLRSPCDRRPDQRAVTRLGDVDEMNAAATIRDAAFDLACAHRLKPLEAPEDGAIGHFGERISTLVLMKKRSHGA